MAAAVERAIQTAEASFALAPMLSLGRLEAELTLVVRGSLVLTTNWRNLIRVMAKEGDRFPEVMADARERLFASSRQFLAKWLEDKAPEEGFSRSRLRSDYHDLARRGRELLDRNIPPQRPPARNRRGPIRPAMRSHTDDRDRSDEMTQTHQPAAIAKPLRRDPRIVIITARISGIATAHTFKRTGFNDFVILEKGSDVGGVWHWNRYPSLTCDVPSHTYPIRVRAKTRLETHMGHRRGDTAVSPRRCRTPPARPASEAAMRGHLGGVHRQPMAGVHRQR